MVIYVSVQYNGGYLPDIMYYSVDPMRLTLGIPFNTMKIFCPYSQCSHLNILIFPPRVNAQEVYMRSDVILNYLCSFCFVPFSFLIRRCHFFRELCTIAPKLLTADTFKMPTSYQ